MTEPDPTIATAPRRSSMPSRIARRLWMRGWLLPILVLALWVFSSGSYIIWQGKGTNQPRASLSNGVITFCRYPTSWWPTFGHVTRTLGTGLSINGKWVTFFVAPPLWSASRWSDIRWLPASMPGHIHVPVFYFAPLAAIVPLLIARARRRRRRAGLCIRCGYDLDGLTTARCPECGAENSPSEPPQLTASP